MFKVVHKVADKGIACFFLAPISKVFQNVSLVDLLILAVASSPQDLEGSELLVIRSEIGSVTRQKS